MGAHVVDLQRILFTAVIYTRPVRQAEAVDRLKGFSKAALKTPLTVIRYT
jgi:hypothetical protein